MLLVCSICCYDNEMDYKDLLGLITIAIAIISYSFYFHDVLKHHTKPYFFSWFIWGMIMTVSFFAQRSDDAGPGSWVIGFTALICFTISLLALKNGIKNVRIIDWVGFLGALLALLLFLVIKQPVVSVLMITLTYAMGFYPTFRKSYGRPQDETLITFVLNGAKFFISIFALNNISFVTAFYPLVLVVINWSFVGLLVTRSKQMKHPLKWFR